MQSKLDLRSRQSKAKSGGSEFGGRRQSPSEGQSRRGRLPEATNDRDSSPIGEGNLSRRSRRLAGKRPSQVEWEQPPVIKAQQVVGSTSSGRHGRKKGHQESVAPQSSRTQVPTFEYFATFERQPPTDIRPRHEIPAYTIHLQLMGKNIKGRACPLAYKDTVNAVAYLVGADGRAIPQVNIELSRSESATAPEHHKVVRDDTSWTLRFRPRVVDALGFFRIRVNIFYTPVVSTGGHNTLGSPVPLLTVKSRVIHVDTFAPLVAC